MGERVIAHRKDEVCPRCKEHVFCVDCGICASCHFATPPVVCTECGGEASHKLSCSITKRAAAS